VKVEVTFISNIVSFRFFPDKLDDELQHSPIHLSGRSCFFELPTTVTPDVTHPDLIALSALLLCYPFVHSRIELDFPVSKNFTELCEIKLGIDVRSPSGAVKKRLPIDGIPALAFSGGVDSNAALSLMPENSIVYFIDRAQPFGKKTLYNKFAAQSALDDLASKRTGVYSIPSDMEYLRSKTGFPQDPLNADIAYPVTVPALLMADIMKIDAFACGAIMDAVYRVGFDAFEDYPQSPHYLKWSAFFNLVECKLFFPTAGITEVGTMMISEKTHTSNYIRSCMRGDENKQCGKCIKCLRKSLLTAAVNRHGISKDQILDNLNSTEVISNLLGERIKVENVYRYVCQFLQGDEFARNLKNRLEIEGEDCIWMERWFPDSIDLIPDKYRTSFIKNVFQFLEPMTFADIAFVKAWDINKLDRSNQARLHDWHQFLCNSVATPFKRLIESKTNIREANSPFEQTYKI